MDVPVSTDKQEVIYISCVGTGCRLEDPQGAMNDRKRWGERVREIYTGINLLSFFA